MELGSESSKPQKKLHTKRWWLWYGILAWGIPFFIAMTIFRGFVMFVVTSILQHRLNWRVYLDPKIHAAGLLAFDL